MGCDIHCWIEYKEPGKSRWTLQRTSPCPSCYDEPPEKQKECWRCSGKLTTTLHREDENEEEIPFDHTHTGHLYGGDAWHDRNYTLFTLLAGVREAIDNFEPMFQPRGKEPPGCSAEYAALVEDEGGDGHSHSWLNLLEVEMAIMFSCDPSQQEEAERLSRYVKNFWEHTVERQMRPLAEKYGPEGVRLVFFFDN